MLDLGLLNEDRHAGEVMVAAGVIRMEMTVRDGRDVGDRSPCSTQRLIDPTHVHRSEAVDELLRLGRKAGVEEEQPLRVLDEERGHDDPLVREWAVGGHGVVTGVNGLDPRSRHERSD